MTRSCFADRPASAAGAGAPAPPQGVEALSPSTLGAEAVVVCGGAWIAKLLPEMRAFVRTTAQHEAFFRPAAPPPENWRAAPFWSFDLAEDGWYGFPPHPSGIVKIARHVPDREADPDGDRAPDPAQAAQLRAFVRERAPLLAEAPDEGRTCLYTLSPDGHFIFDAVPGRPGVFLAGCGSGHAFKFGPVLGRWSADLLEGRPIPAAFRLAGRTGSRVV